MLPFGSSPGSKTCARRSRMHGEPGALLHRAAAVSQNPVADLSDETPFRWGELLVSAYVDHPAAVRCNAWSVSGDVLEYTLHDTDSPSFFARVEKIRLREISLVSNPIQARARVLHRSNPGPASSFVAETIKGQDLMIRKVSCLAQYAELLQQIVRQQTEARA